MVIDHRRSETAQALRCEWVGVRPGTDGTLALGAIQVLLAKLCMTTTLPTTGRTALPNSATMYKASRRNGLPRSPVCRQTRCVNWRGPWHRRTVTAILSYTGLEYSNSGVQAIGAMISLQALAGHLDVPGGKLFKMPNRLKLNRLLTEPPQGVRRKPIGADNTRSTTRCAKRPTPRSPRAILEGQPYPLRALIVSGTSLITAWPNPDLWRRALSALDFLVVINRFPTTDMHYADLVLPAASQFEIESYGIHDSHVQHRQRVIEPLGEARNDYLIFAELGHAPGLWRSLAAK